jgi:hypothetical protein
VRRRLRYWNVKLRQPVLVATGVAAAVALASHVSSGSSSGVAGLPSCGRLAAEVAKQPGIAREAIRQFKASCDEHGWTMVPEATPAPVEPSPGCELAEWPSRPRLELLPQRTVAAPARPIPFFAARTGRLPKDGPGQTVGDITLPTGSRCPSYWATDEPVDNPDVLAARLAAKFPQTGLWPVLTRILNDDDTPDRNLASVEDPARADRVDVLRVLRGLDPRVERLATGSPGQPKRAADPFAAFDEWPSDQYVLLLVPVNRPADVLSLLGGFIATGYMSDAKLTAVARSWEERFGAVLTRLDDGVLTMSVHEPLRSDDDALHLAREHNAFIPDARIDESERTRLLMTATQWEFGWH